MSAWDGTAQDPWQITDTSNIGQSGICKYYSQGRCLHGDACRYQHSGRTGRQGAVVDADYPYQNESSQRTDRDKNHRIRDCTYFLQGYCRRGDSCTFRHNDAQNDRSFPTKITPKSCKYYLAGLCTKGDACTFSHSGVPEPVQSDNRQEWRRVDEGDAKLLGPEEYTQSQRCQFYAKGKCFREDSCPFVHEVERRGSVISPGSSRVCELYKLGRCPRGTACPFRHELNQPPTSASGVILDHCQFYGSGKCFRGDECPFRHIQVKSKPSHDNVPSFGHGNFSRGDTFPSLHGARASSAFSPAHNDRFYDEWHSTSQGVVIEATVREPVGDVVGSRPNDEWPSNIRPVPSEPCKLHQQGNCSPGCNYRPLPSGWEANDAVCAAQDHGGDVRPSWNENNPLTWQADGPPSEKREEPTSEPKNCKFFEQGDCILGAACPDKHDDPAWFAPNEPRNGSHDSPAASVLLDQRGFDAEQPELTVERLMFNSAVRFGQGAVVRGVTTAFESRHLVLSHLPPDVKEKDITDLTESFGEIARVFIETSAPSSVAAVVEFAEGVCAARAAQELHDLRYQSMVLGARLDLPAGRHVAETDGNFYRQTLKISWPTPSLRGWAHYPSISLAKEQAQLLQGRAFGGRKIAATYQSPRKSQTHSFTVELKGLPIGTTKTDIQEFCPGTSSASVDSEGNYDRKSTIQQIRTLITTFEPIDSFEVLSANASNVRIVAFAQFANSKNVAGVVELHRTKPELLKGNTLFVEQVHSTKYVIPLSQFRTLKTDLDLLGNTYDKECKIRYHDRDEEGQFTDPVQVRVYGAEPKTVGRATKAVDILLRGQPLPLEGGSTWDEYFDTPDSATFGANLNADARFFIKPDKRTQTIQCFSQHDITLEDLRGMIIQQLKLTRAPCDIIPISKDIIRPLLTSGLQLLQANIDVTLDVIKRTLVVRGDSREVKRVKRVLAELAPVSLASRAVGDVCSICCCEAVDPVMPPCRHAYCGLCLGHLVRSTMFPNFSPVKCVAEREHSSESFAFCNAAIPVNIICDVLSPTEETKLLESSFMSHLRSHPNEFFFCATPDCQVVHRQGDSGSILRCPSCEARICPFCNVRFHDGLTCEEYQRY